MKKTLKEQKGVALLTAVLVMLMLTVIVMGFAMETGTDIDVGRAYLEKIKTFYIAQAGMNRARNAISLDEAGWDVDAGINQTEAFGSGQFAVTASASAGEIDITSTATIDVRTERVVEELGIQSGGASLNVTVSSQDPSFPKDNAVDYGIGGEPNNALPFGTGAPWKSLTSDGSWIEVDFGSDKTFDYMLFVNTSDCLIGNWKLEIDDGGGQWITKVDFVDSANQHLVAATFSKKSPAPTIPGLGEATYWAVVNFNKTTAEADCDDLIFTNDGSGDHCIGVSNGTGAQTTSKVRLTLNDYFGCSPAGIDWLQFNTGGFMSSSDGETFFLNGTDAFEGGGGGGSVGILPSPTDFTEK